MIIVMHVTNTCDACRGTLFAESLPFFLAFASRRFVAASRIFVSPH